MQPTSLRPITPIVVALTTDSEPSAALGTANSGMPIEQRVRVVSDVDCWIAEGSAPVAVAATTGSLFLPAGTVEYFNVPLGNKIAGIVASGTGTLSLTIMG